MSMNPRVHATRTYTACCYIAFLASLVWCIAFLADLPGATTVDGSAAGSARRAVPVDLGLLLLFAIPHSVLARAGVKQWLRRAVPPPIERGTYVLIASLCMGLLFWQWQSLPAMVWDTDAHVLAAALWTAYALGWAVVVVSTFLSDHLEFFGLRQGGWTAPGRDEQPEGLSQRWLFAWVRHPMMLGLIIVVWATPSMSVGHLLFAAGATGYIVVGIRFEERDLRRRFGIAYDEYAQRVPGLLPRPRSTGRSADRIDASCSTTSSPSRPSP